MMKEKKGWNRSMYRRIKPSKIVCIGLNYRKHAAELKMTVPAEPVIFLKPPSAVVYDGDDILYPHQSRNVHYEAELGVVMGVDHEIAGFICANDVTARDLQSKDSQWTRSKSFDTFCPIGINIVSGIDPDHLKIEARLNGKVVQSSNTSDMIFSVQAILRFVSQVMTLYPDDIILTGTPEGVGPMQPGDVIEIEIEKIGTLANRVANKRT
jgi:2-keto-4-pentenoate hydratase/2-oxohepta-3-ene-1,7-dioic acid hydratase in catechol pathway